MQGADVVMREGRLWLRALDGLEPIDVVYRRIGDANLDPGPLPPPPPPPPPPPARARAPGRARPPARARPAKKWWLKRNQVNDAMRRNTNDAATKTNDE